MTPRRLLIVALALAALALAAPAARAQDADDLDTDGQGMTDEELDAMMTNNNDDGDDDDDDDDEEGVVDDDDVRPSPPSIGADIPVTYFGPAPSEIQPELIGPLQLLKSGTVDQDAGTTTIPLYDGSLVVRHGRYRFPKPHKTVWYVLTDTTDKGNGLALGLNHSPKMHFANTGRGTRWARQGPNNRLIFDQASLVDFSPELSVTPHEPDAANPNRFPPDAVQPGSVGLYGYSPLAYVGNLGAVYNAPVVASPTATADELNAYCDGLPTDAEGLAAARRILHDSVVAICPREQTVTLSLAAGFSFARPVLYLSLDAYPAIPAALEGATLAPGLADVQVGADDSFGSAVERLFAVINGYTNTDDIPADLGVQNHPGRSGFNSALQGEGGPLNVLGGIPTVATDYSPLWDVNIGQWTDEAVAAGFRTRWLEEFQILGFVERGFVTGPGGAPFSSSGALVNCPIVFRFL